MNNIISLTNSKKIFIVLLLVPVYSKITSTVFLDIYILQSMDEKSFLYFSTSVPEYSIEFKHNLNLS